MSVKGPYVIEPLPSLFGGWTLLRHHSDDLEGEHARTILGQGLHEKEARTMANALNAAIGRGEWTLEEVEGKG